MKTTKNTILITGGSAGIGLAMAKLFSESGNHVIITGRDSERLHKAATQLTNVTAIQCDITKEEDVLNLIDRIKNDFPQLNVVINNAGSVYVYKLSSQNNAFEKASEEMMTNYLSVIRMNESLLAILQKQEEAAIVNVSSVVAFAGRATFPTYAASKAALHSYTRTLRLTLQNETDIKVFELMPPLVDTAFSAEIGGANGIKPAVVAQELLTAMQNNVYEIHVGSTSDLYQLSLKSPDEALMLMNS